MSEKLIRLEDVCPYLEAKKIKSSKISFDPQREIQPDSVICDAGFDASFQSPEYEDKDFAIVTPEIEFDFYVGKYAYLFVECEGYKLFPQGFSVKKKIFLSKRRLK